MILVAKVIQNLSNNTLPGTKEPYMQRLNEFITNNQADLKSFFDEILVNILNWQIISYLTNHRFTLKGSSNLIATNREIPQQVKKNSLADIFNIMLSSKEKIFAELQEFYDEGDPIFGELNAQLSGGPIPSEHN